MTEEFGIPSQLIYVIIASLLAPTILGIITFIKRQDIVGQKSIVSEYNINGIRIDLTEVKGDVKELRKEQQSLATTVYEASILKARVDKIEERMDKNEDALRQIDNIKWRLTNIENNKKGAV